MTSDLQSSVPTWLETPAQGVDVPPVQTQLQELPFDQLTWEDFERLCLCLARSEADIEFCRLYGMQGDKQHGIDLYARKKLQKKYRVYQCKRVKSFGPKQIKAAVAEFLTGEWAEKADTFVLCTQESLRSKQRSDEVERQRELLKCVTLIQWDSDELSIKLKKLPELVDDFFGREYVKLFCGEEESTKLGGRLDANALSKLRTRLQKFYGHVFNTHDPGVPSLTGAVGDLPLDQRFVVPDVWQDEPQANQSSTDPSRVTQEDHASLDKYREQYPLGTTRADRGPQVQSPLIPHRRNVDAWLAGSSHSVILGAPGSGKSSLVRYIAIDLLKDTPTLGSLAPVLARFLPVWIPFGLWTQLIANEHGSPYSLTELLRQWLSSFNEEILFALVESALQDDRLLLLVDGLDEWTNESPARIAMDRLGVFIKQHKVPAILTSRPHGFEQLGIARAEWQIGHLAEFSVDQQKDLARIWFQARLTADCNKSSHADPEIALKADKECDGFISELQRSPELSELASNPLLLSLLIHHRFRNAALPSTRFKAYESLTRHLVQTHPRQRQAAASVLQSATNLSEDDLLKVLAHLAYHVQVESGSGIIDRQSARKMIESFLTNPDTGLGLGIAQAKSESSDILSIGASVVGLLVESSPNDLGFLHRVFRESLAAAHLLTLPLESQVERIRASCTDTYWSEVLLGLLQSTSRQEDIVRFVDCMRKESESVAFVERLVVDRLLCQVAFGDGFCPPNLARELAQQTFREIEVGYWIPHREKLLEIVLDGLSSTRTRELMKSKLETWFPSRLRWRRNLYQAISTWPKEPETIECLLKAIHDEDTDNQRTAAFALAQVSAGDEEVGNQIAKIASSFPCPKVRAAAIEALLQGWRGIPGLHRILESARHSLSPELRLISIKGKVLLQEQTEDDRSELIQLRRWPSDLDFRWDDEVANTLIAGWSGCPQTKRDLFAALEDEKRGQRRLDLTFVQRVLLAAYPQDEDVVDFCVEEITNQEYPFNLMHDDAWLLIGENFRGNRKISDAIDQYIPKLNHDPMKTAYVALVGKTAVAKAALLSSLNSWVPHWAARALLEGWGMEDPKVAEALTKLARGPVSEASAIAHLLPDIRQDKSECRKRLLDLLRDPECPRPDFVMAGFEKLGQTQGDSEVVDLALASIHSKPKLVDWRFGSGIHRLIVGYSSDTRVREIAKKELMDREGEWNAVALAYGNDPEIRQRILKHGTPLPAQLRGNIARCLDYCRGEEDFADSLLKLYDHDENAEVKTQASISYHNRLKHSLKDISKELDVLTENVVCYGFDHEERRQAAFGGLVSLGRLDRIVNITETIGDPKPCQVPLKAHAFTPNVPLIRHILSHWDAIKEALGDGFVQRLVKWDSLQGAWDNLCLFADEYPKAAADATVFFREDANIIRPTPNLLRFLGRAHPKSRLLQDYCLKSLHIGETEYQLGEETELVAAELIGSHFGGDPDILQILFSDFEKRRDWETTLVALCEGWPESDELKTVWQFVHEHQLPLSYAVGFQLICTVHSADKVLQAFLDVLSETHFSPRWQYHDIRRPLTARISRDDELLAKLGERLQSTSNPSEKATIPRLIALARGLSPELRAWCAQEVDKQLGGEMFPEIGFDLLPCELRPVAVSLLDALGISS